MRKKVLAVVASLLALWLSVHEAAAARQAVCPAPSRTDIAASPPGDNPRTWICEANAKRPMTGALHWIRNSAEYRAMTRSIYARASEAAARAAKKYGRWGFIVILDADDTLLDTTQYQKEREFCGLSYSDASWCSWVNMANAPAVPGAAEFTRGVHALHGLVAVVTNRDQGQQWVTRENLKRSGIVFDAYRGMQKDSDKAARWKSAVRELGEVARKLGRKGKPPVAVIWVGDQITDMPRLDAAGSIAGARDEKDTGENWPGGLFLLPNPEYGKWQNNVPE